MGGEVGNGVIQHHAVHHNIRPEVQVDGGGEGQRIAKAVMNGQVRGGRYGHGVGGREGGLICRDDAGGDFGRGCGLINLARAAFQIVRAQEVRCCDRHKIGVSGVFPTVSFG